MEGWTARRGTLADKPGETTWRLTPVHQVEEDARDEHQQPPELFRVVLGERNELLNEIVVGHFG